ncbi:MAG: hypothetical protein JNL96_20655 [Planctomycetaceae bacterium]|nr:hypothetical protein [Planctomycetaceae bacterium]
MRALFKHFGFIIVGVLIGTGFAYLRQIKEGTRYESIAVIGVGLEQASMTETPADVAPVDDLLRDQLVLEKAITSAGLATTRTLRDAAEPIAELRRILETERVDRAGQVLKVTCAAVRPDEAPQILAAVLKQARSFWGDEQQGDAASPTELLKQAKDDLLASATRLDQSITKRAADAPAGWIDHEAFLEKQKRLRELERRLEETQASLGQIRSRLMAAEAAEKSNDPEAVVALMSPASPPASREAALLRPSGGPALIDLLAEEATLLESYGVNHPKVKAVRARIEALQVEAGGETQVSKLKAEEALLLETYGVEHPKVRAVRAKLAALSGEAESPSQPTRSSSEPAPAESMTSVQRQLAALQAEVQVRDAEWQELEKLVRSRRSEVTRLAAWDAADQAVRTERDRVQGLFQSVVRRLEELPRAGEAQSPGLGILSPPGEGLPRPTRFLEVLLIGGGLGGLIGLVLSLGQAALSRRETNAATTGVTSKLPVLARITLPGTQDRPTGAAASLPVVDEPQSPVAEAFRSLRAALNLRTAELEHCRLALIDDSAGDLFPVAANLAASYALAGSRTLLVDCAGGANIRPLLSAEVEPVDFERVLCGAEELSDAIEETRVEGMSVAIWRGSRRSGDRHFPNDALQVLRDKFDVILLYGTAAVAEPRLIADFFVLVGKNNQGLRVLADQFAGVAPSRSQDLLGGVVVRGALAR